jgi:glycosyltransferase involved in cell wall biosynthesis
MYRNDLILNSLRLLELKNIEYTCTFIGDGPLLDNQVRNSDGLSKSGNIQFLGQQTKTEIRDAMSGHWIYVSAASSDGTSISLLEAMAAGMICITTDFPSNQEWIQHAVNGFLFPNGDFEALASLIEMISYLTMEEKIKIGKAAKEVILKRGDWKRNQIDFISLVNSMSSKEF